MKLLFTILFMLFITGCAAKYFPAGGSRADGTVELVCNYDLMSVCNTELTQEMTEQASKICENWGYVEARAFGGYINQVGFDYTGQVRIPYQCIGDLEE